MENISQPQRKAHCYAKREYKKHHSLLLSPLCEDDYANHRISSALKFFPARERYNSHRENSEIAQSSLLQLILCCFTSSKRFFATYCLFCISTPHLFLLSLELYLAVYFPLFTMFYSLRRLLYYLLGFGMLEINLVVALPELLSELGSNVSCWSFLSE